MPNNLWAALKGNSLGPSPYSRSQWFSGANAPMFGSRVDTLANLFSNNMKSTDYVNLGPQTYEEGNLEIAADKSGVTIVGGPNRGQTAVEPQVTTHEGLLVLANDVTLVNVGIAKGATADYALKVGSATVGPRRFRAIGCKFEGDGIAVHLQGVGDVLFEDCEFCWCAKGVVLQANNDGFCTQVRFRNCLFHNFTDFGIGHNAAAQVVNNIWVENCTFDQLEDGTEPTDFVMLSDNLNTGIFCRNNFAIATNASAKLTVGTGIMWVSNNTEAGTSTARPA